MEKLDALHYSAALIEEGEMIKARPWHFFGKTRVTQFLSDVKLLGDYVYHDDYSVFNPLSPVGLGTVRVNLLTLEGRASEMRFNAGMMTVGIILIGLLALLAFIFFDVRRLG